MLSGYRVLDLSDRIGWLAGRLLAELGAEVIKIEAPGVAISGADWQAYNVNQRLLRLALDGADGEQAFDGLIAGSDILIESAQPGDALAACLDVARLKQVNPRLIHVSVTPFGREGPRAGWLASDLEITAASGAMSLAGEPGGKPLRISVPQSYCWAGAQAAVGALTALYHRTNTGEGQHVDVSAQAAVILATSHAPAFWDMAQGMPTRAGAYVTGRSIKGARYRAFWPCADGFLNFVLYGGPAGRRTNAQLVTWMKERQAPLGALEAIDWKRFDPKFATQEEVDALEKPIAEFFLKIVKREFLEEASRREMLGYPVSNVADIALDPQLAARNFWQDLSGADGQSHQYCGSFALVDQARAPLRHFPGEAVELAALLAGTATAGAAVAKPAATPDANPSASAIRQALSGVKVAEFGAYAAGPHIGKMLATFGATVVHVESHRHPDGFRNEYPPYKDGKPGVDRSGCFAIFNDSKYAVTLDLKAAPGIELAQSLIGWADIVIENMRPEVMSRLGLGYDTAKQLNPDVVMISSCNMGQTGPRAFTPGFGSQLSALAGFCGLTGSPDGPPMLLYGPYIDFIASTLGASAVLAALDRKQRHGQGAWIDLAQYESGLLFIAGALLDHHQNGAVADRAMNSDPEAAPHDAYPCRGEQWLALSCWSDAEFGRAAEVMGQPELASDPRFAGRQARRANGPALDAIIAAWSRLQDAEGAAALLQSARVHAHPVNNIADLFGDPQLAFRRIWRRRLHGAIGDFSCYYSAFELSATPGDVMAAAPLIGAHNELVFKEFLGITEESYADYQSRGAFA